MKFKYYLESVNDKEIVIYLDDPSAMEGNGDTWIITISYEDLYDDLFQCTKEKEVLEFLHGRIYNDMCDALRFPDLKFDEITGSKTTLEKAFKQSKKPVIDYWKEIVFEYEISEAYKRGKNSMLKELIEDIKKYNPDLSSQEDFIKYLESFLRQS